MRKLVAAAVGAAAAATFCQAPSASAIEVCDPVIPRGLCIYVLDDREFCPGGYSQLGPRIDNPIDGTVLIICALN